ncbi:hypothetical protein Mpet_2322 [Methanolacinia petrolearia DSM 11571]|uniref:Uncharacterized protein n=2 Tax=Methanolacinia TaxID=230355 RepID=E1RD86_METP4|nr:hypothetical protein Mpet_2322 [Methanolacinia petrolearia DSM 11571]
MEYLKSQNLPIKLLYYGGNECRVSADLLYQHCRNDSDLHFVIPLYPDMKERIRGYINTLYPELKPVFIDCSEICNNSNEYNPSQASGYACNSSFLEYQGIEHINICTGAFEYSSISQCEQCRHIIPNRHGLAAPRADGTGGKVWNFYMFYGYSETAIDKIVKRKSLSLSSLICPMHLNQLKKWWNYELINEGL